MGTPSACAPDKPVGSTVPSSGAAGVGLDSLLVAAATHAEEFGALGGGPPDARRIAAA